MSIGSRIKELRIKRGITQEDLAKKIGVTKGAIGNYENEVSSPKIELMYKLFEALDCDANYLHQDDMKNSIYKDTSTPEEFEDIIKKYRNLDTSGQKRILYNLEEETKRVEKIRSQQDHIDQLEQRIMTELVHRIAVPLYGKFASAGSGAYLFDGIPTDMTEVEDTPIARQADFVMGVNGDSMEPDFYDGDKVFVKKVSDLNVGDIGIFLKEENCYIKELGKDRLISHNPDKDNYPDIEADETITVIGKVLGKVGE